ncbi:MAG: methylmalonyl-CoA mutase family protein [Bacteroidetes bacterium]|nr:methylmalonyl-CoA mutase family protein [Bacteroidota bacterium]
MNNNEANTKLFSEFPAIPTSEWENKIIADLKGADYNKKLIWNSGEGIHVKPYYRAGDLDSLGYIDQLKNGNPQIFNHGSVNDWMICQDIGTADIEQANLLAIDAVEHGADAIALNAREITTHKQMASLLSGIDPLKTWIYFNSSKSYPLTLELFFYEVSARGLKSELVGGGINFDPLSYLLLHGDFYVNYNHNLEEAEYLLNTISKRLPRFKSISINGQYFQNSGSTLVQELGFSLASANEYLASLTAKGFTIDSLAPNFLFHFACGSNYFMEIAKLRAARILWAKIVEQYSPKNPDSLKMFIHSSTASWNKTIFDPYVNLLRTTTESMSAALGQADSIAVGPFDMPFRQPDDFSSRIARNQQLILKEESYLNRISDPAAGCYYIESLTDGLAQNAWDLFREVERMGGMIEAVKAGFVQDEVEKACRRKESDLEERKSVLIGTNQFPELKEMMIEKVQDYGRCEAETSSAYKKIRPHRVSASLENLRLSTEEYISKGNRRPEVFLFTFGNLAMTRARAGFATNFFGCAGLSVTDNTGFETIDEGIAVAIGKKPDIVVFCSSDEEYEEIVSRAIPGLKSVLPGLIFVVAGYPKDTIDALKQAGVDDFIHIRSNLMESLRKFCKQIDIPLK